MLYPPFIMWGRFGYPLLITMLTFLTDSGITAASMISYGAGIIALPLSYVLGKMYFKHVLYGFEAALLLALSFNHIVWGGFILTETFAVLLLLLLLLFLYMRNAYIHPVILGIVLTLGVITRFEYFIFLPILLWYLYTTGKSKQEVVLFLAAFLVSAILIFRIFFPLQNLFQILATQLAPLTTELSSIVVGMLVLLIIFRVMAERIRTLLLDSFYALFLSLCFIFTVLSFLTIPFPSLYQSLQGTFGGLRDFIRHDILLWLFFLAGYYLMLRIRTYRPLLFFLSVSLLLLYCVYQVINPLMERYITHLLPFLLLPAAYGLTQVLLYIRHTKFVYQRMGTAIFLILLVLYQTMQSSTGIKTYAKSSYFQTSYEQESARILAGILSERQVILIASFPEAYYLGTKRSTQSIADRKPFLDPERIRDTDQLVIIEDAGMRDIFPEFSRFLDSSLASYRTDSYRVNRYYHYTDRTVPETEPVVLYRISAFELKQHINTYKRS
jgi:hypothetical protein